MRGGWFCTRNCGRAKDRRRGAGAFCGRLGWAGRFLSDLGIQRIRLLSNTPMHIPALEGFGLEIVEQVAIPVEKAESVAAIRDWLAETTSRRQRSGVHWCPALSAMSCEKEIGRLSKLLGDSMFVRGIIR